MFFNNEKFPLQWTLKGRNKNPVSSLVLFIIPYGYIHGDQTLKGRTASITQIQGEDPFIQGGERGGQGGAHGVPRGKGSQGRQQANRGY